jgi:hypothetical protein
MAVMALQYREQLIYQKTRRGRGSNRLYVSFPSIHSLLVSALLSFAIYKYTTKQADSIAKRRTYVRDLPGSNLGGNMEY